MPPLLLPMQRGFQRAGLPVNAKFQRLQGQFPPDDNQGPPNAHPATIETGFVLLVDGNFVMDQRVKQSNHFAIGIHRAGNPDRVAIGPDETLGERGLAVPWRAIQEHRIARDHGLRKPQQHAIINLKFAAGFGKALPGDANALGRLADYRFGVIFERDGQGSAVAAPVGEPFGPLHSGVGQLIREIVSGAANITNQLLAPEILQNLPH